VDKEFIPGQSKNIIREPIEKYGQPVKHCVAFEAKALLPAMRHFGLDHRFGQETLAVGGRGEEFFAPTVLFVRHDFFLRA
jgi:hypothetical protein